MMVNYGGSQISCSDSDHSSLVIFLRGCPYNCFYCHNTELQDGEHLIDIEEIKQKIVESLPLISEVILSGGEPSLQLFELKEVFQFIKDLNLKVGIETSGYNSQKIFEFLSKELVDNVYLDLKTFGRENYYLLTGYKHAWEDVLNLIQLCKNLKLSLQVRTTIISDNYPEGKELKQIEKFVKEENLNWKKQEGG
jgi:pyruvate formate lyase activating enzyme